MARAGSDPFVEQVRAASDVIDVIGAQVALTRAGSRWKGLCPFHQEKTASFFVNPDHQTYHCFGCGAGGDVYSFVMALENMTFPEALQYLADRAGITLPERERRGPPRDQLEQIREALRIARSFFTARLHADEGAEARRYLEGRGIGPDLWSEFGLGFAPDAWDGLLRHAKRWISERHLIEAGLAIEGQAGRVYDRFRNRVIVPIESTGGAPVGFGGRILSDEEPKYLNSPETAVYKKGSVLFGAAQARDAIRAEGRVVLVEGYFDVLSLVRAGLRCVVGSCGTALTPEQARQLRRYGGRIILLFDGDRAGLRAALKALPIVVAEHSDVRVAVPPPGLDPDDWTRRDGGEAVRHGLDHAWSPVAFLEEQVLRGELAREEAARQAVGLAARVDDPLARDLWVQEISGRFGLGEGAVWARLRGEAVPRPVATARPAGSWKPLERTCLQVALEHPDRAADIAAAVEPGRPREEFLRVLRWLGEQVGEEAVRPPSPAELVARAREELPDGPSLASVLAHEEDAPRTAVSALLRALRLRALRHRMGQVTREIRRAEAAGDEEALVGRLAEKQRLAREQASLEREVSEDPEDPQDPEERTSFPGGIETGAENSVH